MNLEFALRMCEAAIKEAGRAGALVSVAVVDGGGHLVAFQRMDGAAIGGPVLAPGKAYTAVASGAATAELAANGPPGLPGFVYVGGGVPLRADGRVVGGIGVSGGTVAQDIACAEAAAALWEIG